MILPSMRPRRNDLVFGVGSVASHFIIHAETSREPRTVSVAKRGERRARIFTLDEFQRQYWWNTDRGLTGGWEKRLTESPDVTIVSTTPQATRTNS